LGLGAGTLAAAMVGGRAQAQQKSEIGITRQPGIIYMPTHVIERRQLIESNASRLGVPNVRVNWVTFASGGAATDALLSGNVDMVNTGVGNMLLLWDRTRGGVKGIISTSAQPLTLLTRNPNVHSLRDFGPNDRIAVPTIRVSTQAILLQIACAATFGADQWAHLDSITVQLGHPDAAAALANPNHEVNSHFSAPPFSFFTLRSVPGVHQVLTSSEIMGGPLSQAQFFCQTRFAEANPKLIEATRAATLEAIDFIRNDRRAALEIYKDISNDRTSTEDLLALLDVPGMMDYIAAPQGTMRFAEHLHRTGTLRTMPHAWTDYYLPIAHDLQGS
jgi:NitT/TauT family transport system substrate-binding protein